MAFPSVARHHDTAFTLRAIKHNNILQKSNHIFGFYFHQSHEQVGRRNDAPSTASHAIPHRCYKLPIFVYTNIFLLQLWPQPQHVRIAPMAERGTCKKYSFKWLPFNFTEMCGDVRRTFSIINLYSFDWAYRDIGYRNNVNEQTYYNLQRVFHFFHNEILATAHRPWQRFSPKEATTTMERNDDEEWWDRWSPNNTNESIRTRAQRARSHFYLFEKVKHSKVYEIHTNNLIHFY